MTARWRVGALAILLVIATAAWYVMGAPSRGSGVEPSPAQVAVSATAIGAGTWDRYLITVKNVADGDYAGDVLLIDLGGDEPAGAPARQPPTSLGQAAQVADVPAVAGQSAYRIPLSVRSRTSRTITVLAPGFFNVVQALSGGRVLDEAQVDRPAVLPVAVLSEVEAPADAILALRYDRFEPRVTAIETARDFPSTPLRLAGYATVVVDEFDTASLSATQVLALRDFVGLGGTLVLAGGAGWRRTLAPLPADLLPLRPTATASLSLLPVARLAGVAAADLSTPAAVGALAAGARRVLTGDGGAALVAELTYGSGRVVQLAFDPAAAGVAGTAYAAMAWGQALTRGFRQPANGAPVASAQLGPDPGFTALLPLADDPALPPAWLVAAILALYVALAGPLSYLLLRRRLGRPAAMWGTVPLTAVIFSAGFYAVGTGLLGSLQDHEVQIIKVGPDQAVSVIEYHRILFLRRGSHVIDPQPGSLVAPLTLETYRTTGSTCERCTTQLEGLPAGAERAVPAPSPVVEESGVVYGSVRVVASTDAGHLPVGLDARLSVQGGRVQGTVANLGQQPVAALELYSHDGQALHRADLAVLLPPGAVTVVDSPLIAAANGAAGRPPVDALLRAVAASELSSRGQAVLVGLTVPRPTRLVVDGRRPPLSGLAVLDQAVTPSSADGSLRDFEQKWLASSTAARSGFSDVYDIQVPASPGPLSVVYDSQWASAVEVYDWAAGDFAAAPSTRVDASTARVAIGPGRVRDGLVRVRFTEPQVSWGVSVWVDG